MLIALSVREKSFVAFFFLESVGHWQALTFFDCKYLSFKLCCHCHVTYDSSHGLPLCAPVSYFPILTIKPNQDMVVHTISSVLRKPSKRGFCEDEAKLGSIVKVYQKETAANSEREEEKKRQKKVSHCIEDCHTDFTFFDAL